MLQNSILEEHQSLQTQILQLQNQLKELPEGKLVISHNGKYLKWYVSDGHTKTYIPKKNLAFAEQLAQKKYLLSKMERLLQEKRALDSYLKLCPEHLANTDDELLLNPDYMALLSSSFKPTSQILKQWQEEIYETNQNYPEHLIHRTRSGIMVRSKSEAMIERFLYTNKIPFRYECALHLDNMVFYPDFTIMHPKTMKLYYWEHFGRMDDAAYIEKTCSKIQTYSAYGLVPSINLITTYETKQHPFSYEDAEKIGSFYFFS